MQNCAVPDRSPIGVVSVVHAYGAYAAPARVPLGTRVPFSGSRRAVTEPAFALKNLPYGYRAANSAPQARPRAGRFHPGRNRKNATKNSKNIKKIVKNAQKVSKTLNNRAKRAEAHFLPDCGLHLVPDYDIEVKHLKRFLASHRAELLHVFIERLLIPTFIDRIAAL